MSIKHTLYCYMQSTEIDNNVFIPSIFGVFRDTYENLIKKMLRLEESVRNDEFMNFYYTFNINGFNFGSYSTEYDEDEKLEYDKADMIYCNLMQDFFMQCAQFD